MHQPTSIINREATAVQQLLQQPHGGDDSYYNDVVYAYKNLLDSIDFLTRSGLTSTKLREWQSEVNLVLQENCATTRALRIAEILKSNSTIENIVTQLNLI